MIEHDSFANDPEDEYYEECDCEEVSAEEGEGTYCYGDRQSKPLTEQRMDDFDDFFRRCKGLSYIFLGSDVNTVVPAIVESLMLLDAIDCPPNWSLLDRWLLAGRTAEIPESPDPDVVAAVRERVAVMQRRGDDFVMVWHVTGDREVHVDCAGSLDDHRASLAHFLAEEVQGLVHCHC